MSPLRSRRDASDRSTVGRPESWRGLSSKQPSSALQVFHGWADGQVFFIVQKVRIRRVHGLEPHPARTDMTCTAARRCPHVKPAGVDGEARANGEPQNRRKLVHGRSVRRWRTARYCTGGLGRTAAAIRGIRRICLHLRLHGGAIRCLTSVLASAETQAGRWWPRTELNRRHKDFQSSALPTELLGRRGAGQNAAPESRQS